jgi:hypothetical protein
MLSKRRWLQSNGALSAPDEDGSKVAILVPFLSEFVQDHRDSRANFEKLAAELMQLTRQRGRDPFHIMGATPADFERVLLDKSVPSVVVAGFGNLSAMAVPLSKHRERDSRFAYLDWMHLAGMASHLKLGSFVMYTCGVCDRDFNAPFPVGVVNSHKNIYAPVGRALYATGVRDNEPLINPATTVEELTYSAIRELFPLQRRRNVSTVLPDRAYTAARDLFNEHLNQKMPNIPPPTSLPYQDLVRPPTQ